MNLIDEYITLHATAFLVLGALICGTYYFGYLKPTDEFRYNMLDCMSDTSRVEYDRCLPIVKNQQG
ncbi:MAG TPA: hypothetical protein EYQ00_09480 [Dehalococcoidia bacterium]|jgi:hypothetical protein|nr:hypothetical protein [Dehalococcoidia bacterium]